MQKFLLRIKHRLTVYRSRHARWLKLITRHPVMIPLVVVVVPMLLVGLIVWLILGHGGSLKSNSTDIVIISYDHQVQTVPSHEPTVGALLKKLNVAVHQGDVVEPA